MSTPCISDSPYVITYVVWSLRKVRKELDIRRMSVRSCVANKVRVIESRIEHAMVGTFCQSEPWKANIRGLLQLGAGLPTFVPEETRWLNIGGKWNVSECEGLHTDYGQIPAGGNHFDWNIYNAWIVNAALIGLQYINNLQYWKWTPLPG